MVIILYPFFICLQPLLIILQTLYSGQHNLNYNFITLRKRMTDFLKSESFKKCSQSDPEKKIFS